MTENIENSQDNINIDEIIQQKVSEAVENLKNKNKELIGKKKAREDEILNLRSQLDEINAAKEEKEREAALKNGEFEKVLKTEKDKYEQQIKDLQSNLLSEQKKMKEMIIDIEIEQSLNENNIMPIHRDAVKALIKVSNQIDVTSVDDKMVASIGDNKLSDFVKSFASSEKGKYYVASANSGGGTDPKRSLNVTDNNQQARTYDVSNMGVNRMLNSIS